jgi:hypothetical protein
MIKIIPALIWIGFSICLVGCGADTENQLGTSSSTSSSSSSSTSSSSGDPISPAVSCGARYEIKGENTALLSLVNLSETEISGYSVSWKAPGATVVAIWGASAFSQDNDTISAIADADDPDAVAVLPAAGPLSRGIALGIRYINVEESLSIPEEIHLNGRRCEWQEVIDLGVARYFRFYEGKLGSTQGSDLRSVCSSTTAVMNTAESGYEGSGYF